MTDTAVESISCIGAGVIGHSWATLFALNNLNVALHDISQNILDRAIEQIKLNLDILIEKSVFTPAQASRALRKIRTTTDLDTAESTVQHTVDLMQYLGKALLVIKKEAYGYIGNRLQRGVFQEANDLVNSGVAGINDIDRAMALGPGLRWAIYGPYMVRYFNTPSHLYQPTHDLVEKGYDTYPLL